MKDFIKDTAQAWKREGEQFIQSPTMMVGLLSVLAIAIKI